MLFLPFCLNFFLEEVKNCYDKRLTATYNENLKTLTLNVISLKKRYCDVFTKGIMITIKAYELSNNIINLYDKFSYFNTSEIILKGIDFGTVKPQYIQVNLSSITHCMLFQIQQLNYQLSALDNCFLDQNTVMRLSRDKFSLSIFPTGACDIQLQKLTQIEVIIGDIQIEIKLTPTTTLTIDNVTNTLALDANHNFLHYQAEKNISIEYMSDFVDQCQEAFINVKINLKMQVNSLTVQTVTKPDTIFVGYSGDPYKSKLIYGFKTYLIARMILDDTAINFYQSRIDTSDTFHYRVSTQYKDQDGVDRQFSLTQILYEFDRNYVIIFFNCGDDQNCLNALKNISLDNKAQFQFDITCLGNFKLMAVFVTFVPRKLSCWQDGILIRSPNKLCVSLRKYNNYESCELPSEQTNMNVKFQIGEVDYQKVYHYEQSIQMSTTGHLIEACIVCDNDECKQLVNNFDNRNFVTFNISTDTNWSAIPISKSLWHDYKSTTIVYSSLGVVVSVACLIETVYIMVRFKKNLRAHMVNAKKNKKHTN